MATLEAVVTELQGLNQTVEINLEANFEINDNISTLNSGIQELVSVMNSFVQTVPAAVMQGFDALLDFEKNQAKQKKREEEVGQQQGSGGGGKEPFTLKGSFMEGFKSDPVGEMKKNVMVSIGNVLKTVGRVAAVIATLFGAITLPMIVVAGAITALVSGVMNFVEDFKAQEGSLFDKIIAGMMGFIDGVLKLITLPIDAMLWVVEKIAGVLGLETIENALSDFSVTDFVDELTDNIKDFLISVKNYISDKINAVKEGFLGFFGLGGEEEEEEETSTKRGMEIPSGKEGAKLSERGQAAVDDLKGSGVPEVDPETGKRGKTIGDAPSSEKPVDPETGKRGGTIGDVPSKTAEDLKKEEAIKQEIKSGATAGEAIQKVSPSPVKMSSADFVKQQQEQFKKDVASGKVKPTKTEKPKPVKVKKIADDFFKEQELDEKIGALQAEQRGIIAQKETITQEMLAKGMRVPADSRDPAYPFADLDKRQAEIRAELKTARAELDKFKESKGPDKFDAALEDDSGFDAALEDDSGFDAALEGSDDFYDEKPMKLKGDSAGNVTTKVTTKVSESGGGSTTTFADKKVDTEKSKALSAEADKMQADLDAKLEGMDDMEAFDYLMTDEGAAASNAIKAKRVEANAAMGSVPVAPVVEPGQDRVSLSETMSSEQSKLDAAKAEESKAGSPVAINAPNTNTTVSNQTINAGPMPSATDKSDRTDRRAAFRGRAI